ncbi:carbohydrate-binding protein [Streptomyces sp. TRM76323]|uniref:Carbohydrate-binding protein n=1 Tax=Streptomyces tamarix TaxID=3078565 RepID=A0ABU3QHZ7_9ACTN|nr:carbohydrate-binding protein [Streptomyces tamarix]MDT9682012.1 carbohydrate-binding protein [Streptomyces tamarix]
MAAGNHGNGEGTPEDDDPFGYLYADGQASGAQRGGGQGGYGYPGPAGAQPGRPRTSYNQVRAVGERPRGQVPPQPQYGQQHGQPHGAPYGQPHPQYAAPETYPGGAPTRPVPAQGGGRGRSGGPNTKGLLIGAVAVVLVVVAGITVALLTNNDDDKAGPAPTSASSAPASQGPADPDPSPSADAGAVELPKRDAATLQLTPPAVLGTEVKGAQGAGGAYVMFNGVGGAASWKVDVPQDGPYTLFLTYSVPGKDAKASLTVNDGRPREINMSNFAHAPEGDWEKGWTRTYSWVQLKKGENTLKMSCEAGNVCDAYLDQVWLKPGQLRGDG